MLLALLAVSATASAVEEPKPAAAPAVAVKADASKGATLYADGDAARGLPACVSCHGAAGNSTITANPKLAGQHENYLYKQLVDLPGYGSAEVSGSAKLHWQRLLGDYVQRREQLAGLILIMDSRRPFTDLDIQMLEWFAPTGKPIHCILTKVDKLNRNESVNALRQAKAKLDSYVDEDGVGFPFTVQLFSALKRVGIEEANDKIMELAGISEDGAAEMVELIEMEDDVEPEADKPA